MTEILMPRNYLEIPEPRLPRVFLELAEEARNVILVNGQSCDTEEVQPQRTGLTRPVFVAEMVDSPPVLNKRALRVTGTSTEMIPNIKLRGRREPVDRSGPVDQLNATEQLVLLDVNTDERENDSADPLGPDVIPAGRGEPVNRLGPVGPQSNTEQPVLLGFNTDKRGNAPTGTVGHDVILAGRGETVDRPDLVGSHNRTEQSVFLGLDVDQVEHVPASTVDPDVMMYRNQPVTDGPVGQDRTRPVGTEGMHAVNDSDRPTAGGPVGRLFNLDPLGPSGMSSLN